MTPVALAAAWADCADRVLAVARRLTHGDEQAAQDLRADAFARAARAEFRGESSVYTWLCAILRSAFLDERRRAAKRRKMLAAAANVAEPHGRAPSHLEPLAVAIAAELEDEVRTAVARLPELPRALISRFSDGLSYKDLAEEQGVTLDVVKTQLYRARRALREPLADLVGTAPRA